MKPWSEKALARHKAQKIGLAIAVLVASTRVVTAQEQHETPAVWTTSMHFAR